MSLRASILKAAIPHIPESGFTRAALNAGLASLPSSSSSSTASSSTSTSTASSSASSSSPSQLDDAGREAVIDTLFGGSSASDAPRTLVEAWEDAGRKDMHSAPTNGGASDRLMAVLGRRLEWSASVGEHLVDAHALLVAPTTSAPLPAPILAALNRLRPPPSFPIPTSFADPAPRAPFLGATGGRLPFPGLHAAAPLAYAWRVADEAVYAAQPEKGRVGVMREPAGAGVEWYSTRAGLAIAYLEAEAHLLQPIDTRTAPPTPGINPHLRAALASLHDSLAKYASARDALGMFESGTEKAISFLELMTRSIAGIVRSRGF